MDKARGTSSVLITLFPRVDREQGSIEEQLWLVIEPLSLNRQTP